MTPMSIAHLEPKATGRPDLDELRHRIGRLESLVHAIEDELADAAIDDEQRLQNIGERVAGYMDDAG